MLDTSTPVVVLVCHHHVGIGIVRSLGRLGVPVYGVDADRFSPAFFSRYCRGKFLWDLHRAPAEESLRFLMQVGRRIGRRSVLIPTSDIATMLVADHADRLAEWFIFPDRDTDLVHSLCSKKGMFHLAKKWNIPTPQTAFPRSKDDVIEYLETAHFPVLLKPVYSRPAADGRKSRWMRLAHSKRELLEHYEASESGPTPNVILQEYIPGGDEMTWTFNGYFDRQGDCRAGFTGRKLRNYPAYFGQASLAVYIKNERVAEITLRFMRAIGYKGPLDIGFRYDARDDRYKVHDVNPRIGAMFRLFVGQNGMDVARALYQDLTGQPVVAATAPVEGRRWIVEDVDCVSALRYWRDGNLTIKDWIRSLRGVEEAAFFDRHDPWPLAGACMMGLRRAMFGEVGGKADRSVAIDPPAAEELATAETGATGCPVSDSTE